MSKVCTSRRRARIRRGFRDREILRGSTDSHPSVFAIVFLVASTRVVLSCFVAFEVIGEGVDGVAYDDG